MKELSLLSLGKLQQLKELRLHVDLGTFDREAVKRLVSNCAVPTITVVPDGSTLYLLDLQEFIRSDPELRARLKIAYVPPLLKKEVLKEATGSSECRQSNCSQASRGHHWKRPGHAGAGNSKIGHVAVVFES